MCKALLNFFTGLVVLYHNIVVIDCQARLWRGTGGRVILFFCYQHYFDCNTTATFVTATILETLLSLQCTVIEHVSSCGTCSVSCPVFPTLTQVVVLQITVHCSSGYATLRSTALATNLINTYSVGCKLLKASSDLDIGRHVWQETGTLPGRRRS